MMQFMLAHGGSVRLGQQLGRGGEGAVYDCEGRHDFVAKVYTTPPDRTKVEKLAAMAQAASPSLLSIAAWPVELLWDDRRIVRGFIMPRVDGEA